MLQKAANTCILLLLVILFLGIGIPRTALAQSTPPEKDENCIGCHENLYFLHDTGKWYCLCSLSARCTFWHGGNPESLKEAEAHLGLVSRPTTDNASACQSCHPDDFQTRLEKFAALGGIQTAHPDSSTYHTAELIEDQTRSANPPAFLAYRKLEPWQWLGVGIVGVLMLGVVYFGYCCWKFDRCNIQTQTKEK